MYASSSTSRPPGLRCGATCHQSSVGIREAVGTVEEHEVERSRLPARQDVVGAADMEANVVRRDLAPAQLGQDPLGLVALPA